MALFNNHAQITVTVHLHCSRCTLAASLVREGEESCYRTPGLTPPCAYASQGTYFCIFALLKLENTFAEPVICYQYVSRCARCRSTELLVVRHECEHP
jgi:hypothetical protein